jgi:ribosomal RNA-processing protein 36
LERALADVPFGELQQARADGSLAARAASAAAAEKKARRASKKRSGLTWICWRPIRRVLLCVVDVSTDGFSCVRGRPMEISTKVRPPRLKEVIQAPKKVLSSLPV